MQKVKKITEKNKRKEKKKVKENSSQREKHDCRKVSVQQCPHLGSSITTVKSHRCQLVKDADMRTRPEVSQGSITEVKK